MVAVECSANINTLSPAKTSRLRKIGDKLLPPEYRTREEFFTVLNGVTAARTAYGLSLIPKVREDPGGNWKKVAITLAGDKESWLAKLGDLPKVGDTFKRLGFRKSEPGRLLDPIADKFVGYKTVRAGMDSGAIPTWLGTTVLAQKGMNASITMAGVARGREMSVTRVGQWGEAIADVGIVSHLAAERIEDPMKKTAAKIGAAVVTLTGMGMSTYAGIFDYLPQAFGNLPDPLPPNEPESEIVFA